MTNPSTTSSLCVRLKNPQGFSLIELMTALLITCFLASSFLGIMVLFSKGNQKSRTILMATAAANNRFERLKSMALSELAELPASQSTIEEGFILQTEITRHNSPCNGSLDLVIKSSGEDGFFSYLTADDLQDLSSLKSKGPLTVRISPDDNGTTVQMYDEDGKTAAFHFSNPLHSSVLNIYTQQMGKNQQVLIDLGNSLPGDWKINVYEHPFPCGNVSFCFKDEILQADQQMKQIHSGELSIQTIKHEEKKSALVYLQVKVFADPKDSKPVSACQGVIKAPY